MNAIIHCSAAPDQFCEDTAGVKRISSNIKAHVKTRSYWWPCCYKFNANMYYNLQSHKENATQTEDFDSIFERIISKFRVDSPGLGKVGIPINDRH